MWKGVLFFLVSAVIIVMGLYSVIRVPLAIQSQKEPMPFEINYADRVYKENSGIPSYMQVPSIYMYADIEPTKLDHEGRLMRLKNVLNVGWFGTDNLRLGQKGVIVLSGEFDRENGRASTFYHLNSLEKNDLIQVTDLNGKKYVYTVIDKARYDWDSTDIKSLLVKSETPKLDIIMYPAHTEENKKNEASHTIIYAEMK